MDVGLLALDLADDVAPAQVPLGLCFVDSCIELFRLGI
jgi:hypothetical protein